MSLADTRRGPGPGPGRVPGRGPDPRQRTVGRRPWRADADAWSRRIADRVLSVLRHAWSRGWDLSISAGLMALVTFSFVDRESPDGAGGLDAIGLAKVAIRMGSLGWFALVWFWAAWKAWIRYRNHASAVTMRTGDDSPQTVSRASLFASFLVSGRWTSPLMLPWAIFTIWAAITILWSAVFSYSLGQWFGLAALVLFAQAVALRCGDDFRRPRASMAAGVRPDPPDGRPPTLLWQRLVTQLYVFGSLYCVMVLIVHLINPEWSGFNREILRVGSQGFVHPTAAGASSALSVLLGVLIFLRRLPLWGWLIAVTQPINLSILYLSSSRGALLMLLVTLTVTALLLVRGKLLGQVLLVGGGGLFAMMLVAPNSAWMSERAESVTEYTMRGQSMDQLRQVSGRSEMWRAVWGQFELSPLVGHGYCVTSREGKIFVWERKSNHDAHHLILQILVSTGIVGGLIFGWAFWRSGSHWLISVLRRRAMKAPELGRENDLLWFVMLVGLWYFGWSQTCVTFVGPIRPESVIFFTLFGILAAHAHDHRFGSIAAAPRATGTTVMQTGGLPG